MFKREQKTRDARRRFLRKIKTRVFANAWEPATTNALFANTIIFFLFFGKNPTLLATHTQLQSSPCCSEDPSLSADLSGGLTGRGAASRFFPNGAVLRLGELGQASNWKEGGKLLVTPRRLLFQSSFAL